MKIIRDKQQATLTFVPVEADEEKTVASIAAMLKPEDQLSYGGRNRDGEGDKFCILYFHAGGRKEERVKEVGNGGAFVQIVHVDGVKLTLIGTTEEDKYEVNAIRNTCYFGSGGLIFLGETEVNGKKAIIVTARRCKHCGAGLIRYNDCEWSVCEECAAKCEHNYVRGAIHGGSVGELGVGEHCDKCGRGKPRAEGEREKTEIEHHLAFENELGGKVVYRDGPPFNPRQAVEVDRLVRRHRKSRRSNVST